LLSRHFWLGDPEFGAAYAKEFEQRMQAWIADGDFKARLSVTDGIDHAAEALVDMLEGKNFGRTVVKIAQA